MAATDHRWAPWWVYVIAIVGANLLKQQFMDGVPVAVNVAVTVGLIAAVSFVVTWVWRATHQSSAAGS